MNQGLAEDRQGPNVLSLQMDALYQAVPAAFLSIFGASMALYTFWSPSTAAGLTVWMTFIVGIASLHISTAYMRRKHLPESWTDVSWSRMARFIYLSAGLSWGLGGAWMLGHGNDLQILVISCIVMGAVMATFPVVVYPPAYNMFQAGALVPLGIGFAISPIEYGWLLATGCALMAAFGTLIGYGMGNQVITGMRLSIENKEMARRLEERGAELEAANRELDLQSTTDPLTGVANRRRLMSFARAVPGSCAVLIADIDHFKAYNDAYGHAEGDICLRIVAETLQMNARPASDLVARLGGEEFAIILTDLSAQEATRMAEHIRREVQSLSRLRPREIRRDITISIGVAYRSVEEDVSVSSLMEEADAASYAAKRAGRNQISMVGSGAISATA